MKNSNSASMGSGIGKYLQKRNLKADLPASIVVFLVALPLAGTIGCFIF